MDWDVIFGPKIWQSQYIFVTLHPLSIKKDLQKAPVAELVDALDLGSSVYDVQVRVLSGALFVPKRW